MKHPLTVTILTFKRKHGYTDIVPIDTITSSMQTILNQTTHRSTITGNSVSVSSEQEYERPQMSLIMDNEFL